MDKKTAIKYWTKAYKKGHPKYSRKQIAEALKKYTGFDVRKPITEGKAGNPYDIDNCSAYGWVTYFAKDGEPFLPVDYTIGRRGEQRARTQRETELKSAETNKKVTHKSVRVDMTKSIGSGSSKARGTFFVSKEAADRVAAACEIDHGGAMTYDYLYGCVELGIISENDIQTIERDDWDIVTVDTYVCGDGAIIFGRDALDDSAEEWNRENA